MLRIFFYVMASQKNHMKTLNIAFRRKLVLKYWVEKEAIFFFLILNIFKSQGKKIKLEVVHCIFSLYLNNQPVSWHTMLL